MIPEKVRIKEVSKVAGYKKNQHTKKSVALLFTKLLEREKKKNISFTFLFTLASKIIKYLGINITKEVKDQYIENYKRPMKGIEDTNKWKDILCSCIERILLKCSCYSKKTIDSINSYQNSNGILHRCRKT